MDRAATERQSANALVMLGEVAVAFGLAEPPRLTAQRRWWDILAMRTYLRARKAERENG